MKHKEIRRGEVTLAKEIIYPDKKSNYQIWHMKNLKKLHEQEERNRIKKEEKDNYVTRK